MTNSLLKINLLSIMTRMSGKPIATHTGLSHSHTVTQSHTQSQSHTHTQPYAISTKKFTEDTTVHSINLITS